MFDKIFLALENDLFEFSEFVQNIRPALHSFDEEYMKDKNLRDAAIDSLIDYLQTLKTKK